MLGGGFPGGLEVQVNAGQAGGLGGEADQHGGQPQGAEHRQPLVAGLHVHHDDRVHQRGARDPLQARDALLLGEQQHVVPVAAGRGDHRGGDLHEDRHVEAEAQRHDQRDDVGAAAGQGLGACLRAVAERGDAVQHAPPGLLRDRALAAQHVGDGARRDIRVPCHFRELDQGPVRGCEAPRPLDASPAGQHSQRGVTFAIQPDTASARVAGALAAAAGRRSAARELPHSAAGASCSTQPRASCSTRSCSRGT